MKKAILASVALLLACLGLSITAGSASAHTPTITADCSGVHLSATSYDAGQSNTWTVTIDGATQSGTFESSFDQTFPVPQSGATTSWSARIAAYDGSYDTGVQSGTVGPCGDSDDCADLPGNQPPGSSCTPPPNVSRTDSGKAHGCDVTFQDKKYGAGNLTYDTVFEDSYVFNPSTNEWDLVTDTTGDVTNIEFARWTKLQQVKAGCIKAHGDDTEVAGEQAHTTPTASSSHVSTSQIPTVVDAGLAGASASAAPVASSGRSFSSVAGVLAGAGLVLILCGAFATRRRTAA